MAGILAQTRGTCELAKTKMFKIVDSKGLREQLQSLQDAGQIKRPLYFILAFVAVVYLAYRLCTVSKNAHHAVFRPRSPDPEKSNTTASQKAPQRSPGGKGLISSNVLTR